MASITSASSASSSTLKLQVGRMPPVGGKKQNKFGLSSPLRGPAKAELQAMELESVNVASMEATKKIQRERRRKHEAEEKLQTQTTKIAQKKREVLKVRAASRKTPKAPGAPKKAPGARLTTAQLEARLHSIKAKSSVASKSNSQLKAKIDHLRLEQQRASAAVVDNRKQLSRGHGKSASLRKQLQATHQHTKTIQSRLEKLMMTTLEEIESAAGCGSFDTLSEEMTRTPTIGQSSEQQPRLHRGEPEQIEALDAEHKLKNDRARNDLLFSQIMVRDKADELHKLIDDHISVKTAMATMHRLRDDFGLATDEKVIETFEETEAINYDLCKTVNSLLKDAALLEKEQSIVENLIAAESESQSDRNVTKSTLETELTSKEQEVEDFEDLGAKMEMYEQVMTDNDKLLNPCNHLVANILQTLVSPFSNEPGHHHHSGVHPLTDLTGALSHIENSINTLTRTTALVVDGGDKEEQTGPYAESTFAAITIRANPGQHKLTMREIHSNQAPATGKPVTARKTRDKGKEITHSSNLTFGGLTPFHAPMPPTADVIEEGDEGDEKPVAVAQLRQKAREQAYGAR